MSFSGVFFSPKLFIFSEVMVAKEMKRKTTNNSYKNVQQSYEK